MPTPYKEPDGAYGVPRMDVPFKVTEAGLVYSDPKLDVAAHFKVTEGVVYGDPKMDLHFKQQSPGNAGGGLYHVPKLDDYKAVEAMAAHKLDEYELQDQEPATVGHTEPPIPPPQEEHQKLDNTVPTTSYAAETEHKPEITYTEPHSVNSEPQTIHSEPQTVNSEPQTVDDDKDFSIQQPVVEEVLTVQKMETGSPLQKLEQPIKVQLSDDEDAV